MKKIKLKWEVSPVDRGFFRPRGWPCANIAGTDKAAFMIRCEDDYNISKARGETPHQELKLGYANWYKREGQSDTFDWVYFKQRFTTLAELKTFALEFINRKNTDVNS